MPNGSSRSTRRRWTTLVPRWSSLGLSRSSNAGARWRSFRPTPTPARRSPPEAASGLDRGRRRLPQAGPGRRAGRRTSRCTGPGWGTSQEPATQHPTAHAGRTTTRTARTPRGSAACSRRRPGRGRGEGRPVRPSPGARAPFRVRAPRARARAASVVPIVVCAAGGPPARRRGRPRPPGCTGLVASQDRGKVASRIPIEILDHKAAGMAGVPDVVGSAAGQPGRSPPGACLTADHRRSRRTPLRLWQPEAHKDDPTLRCTAGTIRPTPVQRDCR